MPHPLSLSRLLKLPHGFGQVNFVDDEFMRLADIVVLPAQFGNVAVNIVNLGWPPLAEILIH